MKLSHNYFVYIIECFDKSYYVGVTNNIERRLWEHNHDDNELSYTYYRRPVLIRYYERYSNIESAIAWEKQLKGWSRKKKKALFISNWEEIIRLSKNKYQDGIGL